ncbi:hypothetical protein [Deinococcus sp. Leaf326]|uniref:hypothetical protein n=1 Tax=Deinococcus sp. Leaf326 TaxID=1736338 RepID=UPI0006F8EA50|nr:hypothetical protein [Deinococcus sp. Leaf326]KQQ98382.1 hypothetical protein ASF71_22035 [Deinococcus sp. Leaf326]
MILHTEIHKGLTIKVMKAEDQIVRGIGEEGHFQQILIYIQDKPYLGPVMAQDEEEIEVFVGEARDAIDDQLLKKEQARE